RIEILRKGPCRLLKHRERRGVETRIERPVPFWPELDLPVQRPTRKIGKDAESSFVRRVHRSKLVALALRHDRIDAAISQMCQFRIRMRRILPEVGENECADDWAGRHPPRFPGSALLRRLWRSGMVPQERFELPTPSLRMTCSTS